MTNWGEAILTSFSNALSLIFSFIPKLLGFLIILLVGWLIANALGKAVTFLLRKVGFDRLSDRIGLTTLSQRMGLQMDAAGLLGRLVYWFIFLIFLIPAVEALGLTSISNVLNAIIAYLPNVFVAILVLFLGALIANFVADIVRGATASTNIGNPNVFAAIARYAILGFVAIVALEELQIAPSIINLLFGAIVFGAALAFGLAFGLGGRDAAQRAIERSERSLSGAAAQISAQQSSNQIPDTGQRSFDQVTNTVQGGAQSVE
jgi:HAMP domain-containing protein